MNTKSQRDELLHQLERESEEYFKSGRQNNITDLALSIVAIFASLMATVLASTETAKWLVASVAAVPAACTSLQRVIDFRGRSNWYFRYTSAIRALANSLKFDPEPDVHEYAQKWGDLDITLDREWAQIGREGSKPVIRKRRGK